MIMLNMIFVMTMTMTISFMIMLMIFDAYLRANLAPVIGQFGCPEEVKPRKKKNSLKNNNHD